MRTSAGTHASAPGVEGKDGCNEESNNDGVVESMVLERPQRVDNVFDFILLKQTDASDAGRSSFQAGGRVFQGDAAEGENADLRPAGFSQGVDASGLHSGSIAFSEDWSKNGEVDRLGLGANHLLLGVAGGGHEKVVRGRWTWTVATDFHHETHFVRCDVLYA
jgi:hypothetical protein